MNLGNRCQFAFENMTLYTGALLILIATTLMLHHFGVFEIQNVVPKSCDISAGFGCEDLTVKTNGFSLALMNGLGKKVLVQDVELAGCLLELDEYAEEGDLVVAQTAECTMGNAGERIKKNIKINYVNTMTGLEGSVTGMVTATVGEGNMFDASPQTLTPSLAESFQDEENNPPTNPLDDVITEEVSTVDDNWAPVTGGHVTKPYYYTDNNKKFFDGIALEFDLTGIEPSGYNATLRFYVKDGGKSGSRHHYIVHDDYMDEGSCKDKGNPKKCAGYQIFDNGYEGWVNVSISRNIWDDGALSLRLWDAYVDKIELYLVPTQ